MSVGEKRGLLSESSMRDTVKRLEESLAEFKRRSDLDGLLRLEAEAQAVATDASGRTRRKATRVANAASAAAQSVRRNGGETETERAARVARESREAIQRIEADKGRLLERLISLLHLLLYEQSPEWSELGQLAGLVSTDRDGFLRIELPPVVTSRLPLLLEGFDRSSELFDAAAGPATRLQVERELRVAALDLVSGGAEVRGLTTDCVPLIGYCLFVGRLPSAIDVDPATMAKVDDLILGVSDEISAIPSNDRVMFFTLLRLAVLLGEAQALAERHSVATLSFS